MAPSQVTVRADLLAETSAEVIALPVRPADSAGRSEALPQTGRSDAALLERLGLDLGRAAAAARFSGRAGQVASIPVTRGDVAVRRVLLAGTGDGSPPAWRRAGAALARAAVGEPRLATSTLAGLGAEEARAQVEGLLLAAYAFRAPGASSDPSAAPVAAVDLFAGRRLGRGVEAAVAAAQVTARAVHLSRDLANMPANVKNPQWLARQARDVARRAGLEITVWDEKALAADGFGGILAVGAGSASPPRLVRLDYAPPGAGRRARHVVLVGKGITFDSGGLSLKPREAMVPMKTDMAGAGAVLAAMSVLRDRGVRARVTALLPLAENLPGAAALRPSDVITHYGGRTVEVLNTDAEGRLVLADALAYADAELDPDVVVDLATLTGAASLGLGRRHAALYATDPALTQQLVSAGEASGERVWPMPLVEEYRDFLDSPVADLANVLRDPHVMGGSITAALFLREFVGDRPWAHLDIAGPARADRDEHEVTRGGTGYGTRLLLRWLEQQR